MEVHQIVDFILAKSSTRDKLLTVTGSEQECRENLIFKAISFVFLRFPGRFRQGIHRVDCNKFNTYLAKDLNDQNGQNLKDIKEALQEIKNLMKPNQLSNQIDDDVLK